MLTIAIDKLEDFEKMVNTLEDKFVFYSSKTEYSLRDYELTVLDRKARVLYKYLTCQDRNEKNESEEVKQLREAGERLNAIVCRYIDNSLMTYTPEH